MAHQVLVRLRVDVLRHQGAVGGAVGVLIRRQGVCAELACQLDLVLDGAVLRRGCTISDSQRMWMTCPCQHEA